VHDQTSVLGTVAAVVTAPVEVKVGWFRREVVPEEFTYREWTIDGTPLRQVVAWPNGDVATEVTPIRYERAGREYERDYLRALLGARPADPRVVMPDGRVPLLVCRVDVDLDCRALTAELFRDDETVEWRDIAWQVGYEPLDLAEQEQPVVTLRFGRAQYDDTVRSLLAQVDRT
jgi:hypothetical protein